MSYIHLVRMKTCFLQTGGLIPQDLTFSDSRYLQGYPKGFRKVNIIYAIQYISHISVVTLNICNYKNDIQNYIHLVCIHDVYFSMFLMFFFQPLWPWNSAIPTPHESRTAKALDVAPALDQSQWPNGPIDVETKLEPIDLSFPCWLVGWFIKHP